MGDRVWNDIDGDGIDESGELGIEGVLVELLDLAGNVLATRTTGPNGEYLFADIPAGDYQVRFTRPAGYNSTPQGVGDPNSDSNADVVIGFERPDQPVARRERPVDRRRILRAGHGRRPDLGRPRW